MPLPEHPRISVVIPLYNKAAYVQATLYSVLRQTHPVWEIVVVDDGSSDESIARVQALGHPRIRLISQPNGGVSATRNRGVQEASGDFCCFLDADDLLHPRYVEALAGMIRTFPDAGLYGAAFERFSSVMDPDLEALRSEAIPPPVRVPDFFARWARGPIFSTSSVCVPLAVLRSLPCLFPDGESLGEDQDLWFRIAERHPVAICPARLAFYRVGLPGSLSYRATLAAPLPSFERLRQRIAAPGFAAVHRSGAHALITHHYINVARGLVRSGNRRGALELLGKVSPLRAPLHWLRVLGMTAVSGIRDQKGLSA